MPALTSVAVFFYRFFMQQSSNFMIDCQSQFEKEAQILLLSSYFLP